MTITIKVAKIEILVRKRQSGAQISGEKSARLEQARERIHDSIDELNQSVEQGDLSAIEAQHAQLAALVLEQEYLEKLRTWPWPRGTFAGLLGLTIRAEPVCGLQLSGGCLRRRRARL